MPGDKTGRFLPDDELWQRSGVADAVEDEFEDFLDLAGFADRLLDEDEHERVAARLAGNVAAAEDVEVAVTLAAADHAVISDAMAARACTLVVDAHDNVVPFRPRSTQVSRLPGFARWGGLAAAIVVAGWLGFTLGMDTSRDLVQSGQSAEDNFMHELLDPSTGFLRDLTEGNQT